MIGRHSSSLLRPLLARQRFLAPVASHMLDRSFPVGRLCLASSVASSLPSSPPLAEQPSPPSSSSSSSSLGLLRLLKDEERQILEEQKKLKEEAVSTTLQAGRLVQGGPFPFLHALYYLP